MYESIAKDKPNENKTTERTSSPPKNANMGRRASIVSGNCPFSGAQVGNKAK